MRATALEQETDQQTPAHAAETQRENGASPVAQLGAPEALVRSPPGLLNARLLLGLQATAGNAAVAGLIQATRASRPAPAAGLERRPAASGPETTTRPDGVPDAHMLAAGGSQPALQAGAAGLGPEAGSAGPAPEAGGAGPAPVSGAAGPAPEAGGAGPAPDIRTPEIQTAEPAPSPEATKSSDESDDELAALDAAAGDAAAGDTPVPEAPVDRESVAQDAQAELAALGGGPSAETSGGPAEPGMAIERRPPTHVPDVSADEPASGLARVAPLPPHQLLSSLGAISGAAALRGNQEHARLAANPPKRPRHPGAPSTVNAPASVRMAIAEPAPAPSIPKVPEGQDTRVTRPAPAAGSLGPAPRLPLEGSSDPAAVQQQRTHVLAALERQQISGQQQAAQPMGENEIFPTAPPETLRAAVATAPGSNGHAPASPPAEDEEAVSIIAQQERAGEIQSAIGGGLTGLASRRQEYEQRTSAEQAKADAEMAQLEHANSEQQVGERASAKQEVLGLRGQWSGAQRELVAGAQREADAKTSETMQTVAGERGSAEQQVAAHYQEGQRQADQARREGEQQAAAERQKAEQQGQGGLLGAVVSAAQSFVDQAKRAVLAVVDRVRQVINTVIDRTVQLAMGVLERARQAIVGAIRAAGNVLVAIGDRVLAALPALGSRFRRLIQDRIAAAEAVVNGLANALKQAIQTSLNVLGAALSAAVGLWQRGMQAAIDGVRAVVQGAIQFARSAIAAMGTFAVLVKDIAAGPARWVANLAAGARDGIRNHLWPSLKLAVQSWFNEKVDSVLGLGSAVWNLLKRGGITVAQVGHFAWEAIKSMIPQAVIWILIEKLVSLLVPAAAAVMLIIQALQAAWSSLGRILQAFDAFIAFLKGVRWGNAGPLFGGALAAGAVAVIEFISQFLLQRLMSAAGAVASKIRALAKRIGARLAGVTRAVVRGAKGIGRGVRAGVKRGLAAAGAAGSALGRGAARIGHRVKERLRGFGSGLRSRSLEPKLGHEFATARAFTIIEKDGTKAVRYGPLNPGPLHQLDQTFVDSFRSSSYTGKTLAQPKRLYRSYSDPEKKFRAYWTDVKPQGPLQATIDSALLPNFENAATRIVEIEIPAGQTIFEGFAAEQNDALSGVSRMGGGRQVVATNVDPAWEVK